MKFDFYEKEEKILSMCGKIISFGQGLAYNKTVQREYEQKDLLKKYLLNCREHCNEKTFINLLERVEDLMKIRPSLKGISKIDIKQIIKYREKCYIILT